MWLNFFTFFLQKFANFPPKNTKYLIFFYCTKKKAIYDHVFCVHINFSILDLLLGSTRFYFATFKLQNTFYFAHGWKHQEVLFELVEKLKQRYILPILENYVFIVASFDIYVFKGNMMFLQWLWICWNGLGAKMYYN